MINPKLADANLRNWISGSSPGVLDGLGAAIEDEGFREAIRAKRVIDVRLSGDPERPLLPGSEILRYDEDGETFDRMPDEHSFGLVIVAGILQRVVNPFRLLAQLQPLLIDQGALLISAPMRELFVSGRELLPHEQLDLQRRFYTIASLFLDVQAAWGMESFNLRFAREYNVVSGDRALERRPYALIAVFEKQPERAIAPLVPTIRVDRAPAVVSRSEDEALLAIDVTQVLAPALTPAEIERVCILKLDHIGDFIMALPVFDDVRTMFPKAKITFVCGSWNVALATDLGSFDEVIACDFYTHNGPGTPMQSALARQRLGAQFEGRMFDIAIDLRVPTDSRDIIALVPARYRAAIGRPDAYPFLDVALPAFDAFNVSCEAEPEAARIVLPADAFSYNGAVASPPEFRLLCPPEKVRDIIWGPYITLGRGAYTATWLLSSAGGAVEVEVDVAVHDHETDRTTKIRQETIEVGESGPSRTVEFELYADIARVEFRTRLRSDDGSASLIFTGVTLERITGRPTTRQLAPGQVHMKEQMSLLLALVRTRLFAPAQSAADVRRRLMVNRARPAVPFFAVVPYSNSELRNWPLANFRALARLILDETDASVRLIGSAAQTADLDAFSREIAGDAHAPRVENYAGEPWSKTYASLVEAEAVISNNSGIAHMAGALGANVVAIYSASHQVVEWGPIGPRVNTIQAALPCGQCGFDTMPECLHGHRCMQMIDPRSVLDVLQDTASETFHASGVRGARGGKPGGDRMNTAAEPLVNRVRAAVQRAVSPRR